MGRKVGEKVAGGDGRLPNRLHLLKRSVSDGKRRKTGRRRYTGRIIPVALNRNAANAPTPDPFVALPGTQLSIRCLPRGLGEKEIVRFFRQFGKVVAVFLSRSKNVRFLLSVVTPYETH